MTTDHKIQLKIPALNLVLTPGSRIRLKRFETTWWILNHGWYTVSSNRPICGWYLVSADGSTTRSLQLPDLNDIYMVE